MAIACDTRHAAHALKCSLPAGHAGPHLAPFTWTGDGTATLRPTAIDSDEPEQRTHELAAPPARPRPRKPW